MRRDTWTMTHTSGGRAAAALVALLLGLLGSLGLLSLPAQAEAQEQGSTVILPLDIAGNVRGRYAIRANRSITSSAEAHGWLTFAGEESQRPGSCLAEAACLAGVGRELGRDRVVGIRMSARGEEEFRLAVLVVASANGQILADQSFTLDSHGLMTDTGGRVVSMITSAPAAPALAPAQTTQPTQTAQATQTTQPTQTNQTAQANQAAGGQERDPDYQEPRPDTNAALNTALNTLEEQQEGPGEPEPVHHQSDVPDTLEHAAHAGQVRERHVVDDDPLGVEDPESVGGEGSSRGGPHANHPGHARHGGPWAPGWLIATAGGLVTVVGLGVGAYTLVTYNDCAASPCTEAQIRDGQNVGLGADALTISGLGLVGLGVILALALAEEDRPARDPLEASLSCGPAGCEGNLRLRF